MIEAIVRDTRDAARTSRNGWGVTAVAVLSLGLGLGANAAIFSLVDTLLLRSLPIHQPERLVVVRRTMVGGKLQPISTTALDAIRGLTTVFSDAAQSAPLPAASLAIDRQPESGRSIFAATTNLFTTLGIAAERGQITSAEPAAILSDRFWRSRFLKDPHVIGRSITVDGQTYPIVGIAAAAFQGTSLDSSGDVWLLQPSFRAVALGAFARLMPGVTIDQARAATELALDNAQMDSPSTAPIRTVVVPGGQGDSSLRERYRYPLIALVGLVALVLLITCANLGNLLAVRNMSRAHELRMRIALGASRSRLVRQLLVEGLVLAAFGGVVAWLLARWGVALLVSTLPSQASAVRLEFHTDTRMLIFMAATTLGATIGFTLLPAWRATRIDSAAALKSTPTAATPSDARRLSQWMVGAQVACSVTLVAGAGLFVQTVRNVTAFNLGFEREGLLEVEINEGAYV